MPVAVVPPGGGLNVTLGSVCVNAVVLVRPVKPARAGSACGQNAAPGEIAARGVDGGAAGVDDRSEGGVGAEGRAGPERAAAEVQSAGAPAPLFRVLVTSVPPLRL